MEFIRIPRNLIYDKELGDKRILIYSSLIFNFGSSRRYTLENLIGACDYTCKRMDNGAEQQFQDILNLFHKRQYISIHRDLEDVFSFIPKTPRKSFGIIDLAEYKQILNFRQKAKVENKRINHAHIILLLSYIRMNMDKREGYTMMHFSMLKTISDNIGLSVRSITAALKVLEELSIIHSEELPRYKDKNNNWHTNVKVFVNMNRCSLITNNTNYDWRKETEVAIATLLRCQREYIGG